tara:strand:- start:350 stop:520 length:171 start_codon:yes stop_codon:yes gene_type:complete
MDTKQQLKYLFKELDSYTAHIRTWSEENAREDYKALINIKNKINDIIKDKEVYTTK